MSTIEKPVSTPAEVDPETARLVKGIEQTRADMTGTLAALETRLSPAEIRGKVDGELQHVEDKVREVVREHLAEAKTLVQEELLEAKTFLRAEMNEAEAKITRGLSEARDTVKKDLALELESAEAKIRRGLSDAKDTVKKDFQEAVTRTKESVRAATVGKVEDLATKLGDTMNDTRDTLIDTIRANPLPAAVAGIGLAWLLMNRSSKAKRPLHGDERHNLDRDYNRSNEHKGLHRSFAGAQRSAGAMVGGVGHAAQQAKDTAGDAIHHVKDAAGNAIHHVSDATGDVLHKGYDAAGNVLHQVTDGAGNVMHLVTDTAGNVIHQASIAATAVAHGVGDASMTVARGAGDAATYVATGARNQARWMEQGFQTTLRENPLALGAAAVAIGAAIGYALPRTHGEDVLMGEKRDELFHLAEGATHDAAGLVGKFAEKSVETAKGMLGEGATASK